MEIKDGGPAFPCVTSTEPEDRGMTLRDWFAGQALMGLMTFGTARKPEDAAEYADKVADAMIARRSK